MTITKFGHSCLLIEEAELRALIDPGIYSTGQNEVKNVDLVLITHEHPDHCDIGSLKTILRNNPGVKIITNRSVGAMLDKEGITCVFVENGEHFSLKGVLIEGIGKDHAIMHSSIPPIKNVGYCIANRFFYPGDALTNPGKPVEILALPVAAPWSKLPEVIDYALSVKPKICFPAHDAILKAPGSVHRIPGQVLPTKGIQFFIPEIGKSYTF